MNELAAHREKLDLTRSEVAILVGVTPSYVGNVERGEVSPGAGHVARLADLYGVPETELTTEIRDYREQLKAAAQVKVTTARAQ